MGISSAGYRRSRRGLDGEGCHEERQMFWSDVYYSRQRTRGTEVPEDGVREGIILSHVPGSN